MSKTLGISSTRLATFEGSPEVDPPEFDASSQSAFPSYNSPSAGPNSVRWVGNATCILELNGVRIMTDPNFLHQGDHVHLGPGVTAQRMKNPAFGLEECPPVDMILLSHLHEDHFDVVVADKLRRSIPIVSTSHATKRLADQGYTDLIPLETWESVTVHKGGKNKLRITAMPGKHTLGVFDTLNEVLQAIPPVMGSLIEVLNDTGDPVFSLYISGDTLYYDELKDIHTKYPHIDLALLHLGGTTLPIINVVVTMDAEQGIKLLYALDPDKAIPIHFDDYDAFKSPLDDFKTLVEKEGWSDRVMYLGRGEAYHFDAAKGVKTA